MDARDSSKRGKHLSVEQVRAFLDDSGLQLSRSNFGMCWEKKSSKSSDNVLVTVISAFGHSVVKWLGDDYFLAQLWVPKEVGGRLHMTTLDQLFAFGSIGYEGLCKYRKHCMSHDYLVEGPDEEQAGPVGRVYRSGQLESAVDVHMYSTKDHPLRDVASQSGFRGCIAFPIFDSWNTQCIGVLEFLSDFSLRDACYRQLKGSLSEGFLRTASVRFSHENSCSYYRTREPPEEISQLLKLAIHAVPELHLTQFWVPCRQYSEASNNLTWMERIAFSTARAVDANVCGNDLEIRDFVDACRIHNLRGDRGIAGHILSTPNTPSFCRNIGGLSLSVYPFAHYARAVRLSFYFAICLQNVEAGNSPCIIEFFLHLNSTEEENPSFILRLLLHLMKRQLKRYTMTSGKSIGAEVVAEVTNKNSELVSFELGNSCLSSSVCKNFQDFCKMRQRMAGCETWISLGLRGLVSSREMSNGLFKGPSDGNSMNSPLGEIPRKIQFLIKSMKDKNLFSLEYLVQFWALGKIGDRSCLTTSDQPFALNKPLKGFVEYRKRCMDHQYFVNDEAKEEELGPPGRAFQNGCPEYSPDVRLYCLKDFPMRDHAVYLGLRTYLAVPIFDIWQSQCIGVLEFIGFNDIHYHSSCDEHMEYASDVLKEASLRSTHMKVPMIEDNSALMEIKVFMSDLKVRVPQVVRSEVWVPCNEFGHDKCMQLEYAVDKHDSCLCADTFGFGLMFCNKMTGKGIIGMVLALESKSCFFPNFGDMSIFEEQKAHHSQLSRLTVCFAIALRRGNDLYVVEFYLGQMCRNSENFCAFLSNLLPIMKGGLKNFKIASGREIKEELMVEVIEFGKTSEFHAFIERGPEKLPFSFKVIQCGPELDRHPGKYEAVQNAQTSRNAINAEENSMAQTNKVSTNIGVGAAQPQSMNKINDFAKEFHDDMSTVKHDYDIASSPFNPQNKRSLSMPGPLTSDNDVGNAKKQRSVADGESTVPPPSPGFLSPQHILSVQQNDIVIIKATLENETVKFELGTSSDMKKVEGEVARRFKLEIGRFKLRYLDEDGQWIFVGM